MEDENQNELLQNLPCLTSEHKETHYSGLTFEEVSAAVMELSSGRTPGLDGLPNEFYKHFWNIIGYDVFDVLQESFSEGYLPKSCQWAILTLLPKKGDLTLLKNWRPVALLCSEYKILSKCLSIRLNNVFKMVLYTRINHTV